ncbi:MAG: hypothetical protein A3F84_18675 [Candidatus Handelsmanbacteria bacterium RIFCSPLOWO2_12_FULL_64_10]|uniref:NTP pyrophosphohydrolase MazG putative catalytic core domain-containing protein n=1 Tax=Handelsmanbacteria sp. (strain RIFCSPLOWO2_12_FULL_64_10) TaxID=1817868 RepID=A0A1F6CC84_HANXR|nr:MAG: hypothetical protein A3F84_18675 [Candidatus Handelsmanbacteria bacterium RIFCSPLOWO2_12_FULL_64_10]
MWRTQEEIAAFDAARFTSLGPGYLALNLAGEAGELANLVKKLWRADPAMGQPEGFSAVSAESRVQLADEMADVVITTIVLANHLGIDVEIEVARKLAVIDERLRAGYYGREARPS